MNARSLCAGYGHARLWGRVSGGERDADEGEADDAGGGVGVGVARRTRLGSLKAVSGFRFLIVANRLGLYVSLPPCLLQDDQPLTKWEWEEDLIGVMRRRNPQKLYIFQHLPMTEKDVVATPHLNVIHQRGQQFRSRLSKFPLCDFVRDYSPEDEDEY